MIVECVKIDRTNRMEAETFLQEISKISITDEEFLQHGYLIKDERKTIGFYLLEPIDDNEVWLRKFIIAQLKEATCIIEMMGLAILEAKKLFVDKLVVLADRPILEQLLVQLGFQQTETTKIPVERSSTCWEYSVNKQELYPQ